MEQGKFYGWGCKRVKFIAVHFTMSTNRAKEFHREPNFRSFSHRDTSWRSRVFIGIFFSLSALVEVSFSEVRGCGWGIVWVFFSSWQSNKCIYSNTRGSSYSEKFAPHVALSSCYFPILQGNPYGNFRYLNQISGFSAKACYSRGQRKPPASPSCPFLLHTDPFCV